MVGESPLGCLSQVLKYSQKFAKKRDGEKLFWARARRREDPALFRKWRKFWDPGGQWREKQLEGEAESRSWRPVSALLGAATFPAASAAASLTSGLWSSSGVLPSLSGSWIHSKCYPPVLAPPHSTLGLFPLVTPLSFLLPSVTRKVIWTRG